MPKSLAGVEKDLVGGMGGGISMHIWILKLVGCRSFITPTSRGRQLVFFFFFFYLCQHFEKMLVKLETTLVLAAFKPAEVSFLHFEMLWQEI